MPKPKYQKFKKLFRKKTDPWGFSKSAYEKARFAKMLALAKSVPHQTVLEIGCAEGHFTKMLTTISESVTAIDVSRVAIKRAREKAPRARFVPTSIDDFKIPTSYDLIVASEILYFIRDKKPVFEKIQRHGQHLLMSNFGLWDLLFDLHLRKNQLKKRILHLKPNEAKFCIISLWQINPR